MENIKALSSPSVILKNVQARDNKLITNIEVSPEIARFFLEDTFFAEYNVNLENIPESILSIPALSTILTVAWAVGADVYIDEIDETYLHAMTKVKEQWATSSRIEATACCLAAVLIHCSPAQDTGTSIRH